MIKELSELELKELSLEQLKSEYRKLSAVYAKRLAERWKEDADKAVFAFGERLTAKGLREEYLIDVANETERQRYINAYLRLSSALGGISTKRGFGKIAIPIPKKEKGYEIDIEVDRKITSKEDFYTWADEVIKTKHPEAERSTISRILKNNDNSTAAVLEELYNRLKRGR